MVAGMLALLASPAWATYRIQKDDRGIWITASGDEFPSLATDRPHNGAMFYRLDQRKLYVWTESLITIPDRGFWTEYSAAVGLGFPLLAPDGSAAAPSYSFTDQTGTGMSRFQYLTSSVLSFATDGGQRMILSTPTADGAVRTLQVNGTLPTSPTVSVTGTTAQIVSAGTAAFSQVGHKWTLEAGYTGPSDTVGMFVSSLAAGTSTLSGSASDDGNTGLRGNSISSTSGTDIGVVGFARNSGTGFSIGVIGEAVFEDDTKGIGVIGHGSVQGVGGYFLLESITTPFVPVAGLATALVADNGVQTGQHIFAAFHGGTATWRIIARGAVWAKIATKTLTESSATSFVRVDVSSNNRQGGKIEYCVDADDGTDFQTRCGSVTFASVNKAGTETCTLGTPSDVLAESTGASTLTVSFTAITSATNACDFQANATSSLTQTTLRINYTVTQHGNDTNAILVL